MRKLLMTLSTGAVVAFALCLSQGTRDARADVYYPWCANYGGSDGPGVPVCSL